VTAGIAAQLNHSAVCRCTGREERDATYEHVA